jgi:hypothetical protein
MDFIEKPFLIEPGVKSFLNESLKQCHNYKTKYYNILINIGLFILFIIILSCILFYKYKGRLTPMEKEKMNIEKQEYILNTVKKFQEAKRIAHQELITGLPNWDNDYEAIHKIKY